MTESDHSDLDDPLSPQSEDSPAGDQAETGDESVLQVEDSKLTLTVDIESRGLCERHLTVTVSREDIDQRLDEEYSELVRTAQVPGFRSGRAPKKLVEAKFRKDVAEKVKNELLMSSFEQINEKYELSAISEPNIDIESIELPEEGPMTFEFDLEVRPDFEVPQWKGLTIERPVHDFTDEDVSRATEQALGRYGQLVPTDDAAELGDYITTNLTFSHHGTVLSSASEEVIRIRPVLSFRDGTIDNFGELMTGVRAGETRESEAELTDNAPNLSVRGMRVSATFDVLEVKKLELPELTPRFLAEIDPQFKSEADLRDAVLDDLNRQLEYRQHRRVSKQVTDALVESANWELPPELLKRQTQRELERSVLELRRSGFSEEEIQGHANEVRRNSLEVTSRALKEHFILEKIADIEEIEDTPEDYDNEIDLIAAQSGSSARRVRARLEKSGNMDSVRNQIIEHKVISLILAHAEFKDTPFEYEIGSEASIDRAAGGGESDIPKAKPEHDEKTQEDTSEESKESNPPEASQEVASEESE